MTHVEDARRALDEAAQRTPPACDGAPEFTADDLSDDDLAWCREVCRLCPIFELCDDYASTARPAAGFWAGRVRKGRGMNDRTEERNRIA